MMTTQGPDPAADDAPESRAPSSLFEELQKRHVVRAAIGYAVVAWGITEILDGVISQLGWPDWIATLVVIVFVVGFPVAMFLAWVFDWTKEGIRRTEPWTAAGGLSIALAGAFLVGGTAGLFWLINPSGIARVEQTGIAVLPCRYRGDADLAFRGEGFAMLLNEQLASTAGFFVPEFAAVVRLSRENLRTVDLAERLGVGWLVECRVIQEGDSIRIDATLIDAASDESEPLESVDASVSAMVGELEGIEAALLGRFGLDPTRRPGAAMVDRFPASHRALDAYLQAEAAFRIGNADAMREARGHFQAAQVVPGFDLARIREADAMMAVIGLEPPVNSSALRAVLRAVGLILEEMAANEYPQAEFYSARLRFANLADRFEFGDRVAPEDRREWFDRALTLKPNDAEPYRLYADYLRSVGESDAAAKFGARADALAGHGRAGE
jgi:TolB-like protein